MDGWQLYLNRSMPMATEVDDIKWGAGCLNICIVVCRLSRVRGAS